MTTTDIAVKEQGPGQELAPISVQLPATSVPRPDELNVMKSIAMEAIKAKGMVPSNVDTAEKAFAIMLAGWELGAKPMTSLRHISW